MEALANAGAADFKGNKLCEACWNGRHWVKTKQKEKRGRLIGGDLAHNCAAGPCECPCRIMQREREAAEEAKKAKK